MIFKKKLLMFICLYMSVILTNAQTNFKWDIVDSVPLSKSQIYSLTKVFIAKTWVSVQHVIQDDDKESDNIIVKGASVQEVSIVVRNVSIQEVKFNYSLNVLTYVYHYTVSFIITDNKYRIIVDNVCYQSATSTSNCEYSIIKIEPFDNKYVRGKLGIFSLTASERQIVAMMIRLKKELQSIIDKYIKTMKSQSVTEDW